MDLLWVLHAPFWQKMYFVGIVVGYALFMELLLEVLPQTKKNFKAWKKNYFDNEYPKVKAESKRIVREMKQKMFGKVMCVMIMGMFVMSGLFIFTNTVSATITGNAYSGSGNWTITNPTVYTGETVTVYGDITINTGGSLTLSNTILTIDQDSRFDEQITIESGFLSIQSGSTIQSTNATTNLWNTYVIVNANAYFALDNSTSKNIFWQLNSFGKSRVNNCTFNASGIWVYNEGIPINTGPLTCYNTIFLNDDLTTNIGGYITILALSNNNIISYCHFDMNTITLYNKTPQISSVIRVRNQNNISILSNHFTGTALWPGISIWQSAAETVNNCLIYGNIFDTWGTSFGNHSDAIELVGNLNNCHVDYNIFSHIRNGSIGIHDAAYNVSMIGNHFVWIDSLGLINTRVSSTIGIAISAGHTTIDHTIIDRIDGPYLDANGNALGIQLKQAHSVLVAHGFYNMTAGVACPLGIIDNTGSASTSTDIVFFANTIRNVSFSSNGIDVFGGNQALIKWNNITDIYGSCAGFMVDSTAISPIFHNNSVRRMFSTPNVWPDWQIVVGAYTFYAGGSTSVPIFTNNHCDNSATEIMPSYNITGQHLGGGWDSGGRMLVDTHETSIIQYIGANVTLRHDMQILRVFANGLEIPMRFYSNHTSWAWLNITYATLDPIYHIAYITPSNIYLDVSPVGQKVFANLISTNDKIITWYSNATGSAIANFTVKGLINGNIYYVYVDGIEYTSLLPNNGEISFEYSTWSEHQFSVITVPINTEFNALIIILIIVAVASLGLILLTVSKEQFRITTMLYLMAGFIVIAILLPIAILVFWR